MISSIYGQFLKNQKRLTKAARELKLSIFNGDDYVCLVILSPIFILKVLSIEAGFYATKKVYWDKFRSIWWRLIHQVAIIKHFQSESSVCAALRLCSGTKGPLFLWLFFFLFFFSVPLTFPPEGVVLGLWNFEQSFKSQKNKIQG